MLAILSALAGPFFGALLSGLSALAVSWMNSQRDQQLGATKAAAATATQAAAEAAVAQAEATAPKTQAQDVAAFDAGSV